MRHRFLTLSLLLGSALFCFNHRSEAGTNLLTTSVQASGANWTAAIWKTNNGSGVGTGTAVAPVAGNTYTTVSNGISIGNGLNNTRIRCPAVSGQVTTFPGDLLTLNTNTELRTKQSASGNSALANTLNFPGVGTNGVPGLILNGGMINGGDDGTETFAGRIQVAAQSYISDGANGGGGGISPNRSFNISGVLSGTGNMVIINCSTTFVQQISGNSNTYSGQWILQCGWLQGSGSNSLGTNSITVDPNYTGYLTDMPSAASPNGPTRFEPNYDLNSAGVLTLVNGGIMRLHQNVIFSAVNIESTPLTAGTHFYSELAANFPGNFETGGSGSITVQPYGPPPALAPTIATQPVSEELLPGNTATFSAVITGHPPFTFQWLKNSGALSDVGNISGSATNTLTVSNISTTDNGNYQLIITSAGGSVTSSVANLTVVMPRGEAVESAVLAAGPVDFYEFNETNDPSTGNALAFDIVGGKSGVYGVNSQNGFGGITGATAADGFPGFTTNDFAAQFDLATANSHVSVPNGWNLNTNVLTITAWLNPNGPQDPIEGLVLCRGGNTVAGLNYAANLDANNSATLGYTWDNEYETYSWNSGIEVPSGQWSFVALVVTPTNATLHMMNANGLVSATHTYAHVNQNFNNPLLIGDDSNSSTGARAFSGKMDDVAVFNGALTKSQLTGIFYAGSGVTSYAPIIATQPVSTNMYVGQTAIFSVTAGGSDPLTYQWQSDTAGNGIYNNISNGGRFSGAGTATLTIQNIGMGDANNYQVIVSNSVNAATSSAANLGVQATSPAVNITMTVQEASGADWDTTGQWSDGNPASLSSASEPGSTYELLAGSRLRSPANPRTATFPGVSLKVDGNGIWINNPGAGTAQAEFRFKQPIPGTVIIPKLIMNGGQLDTGNPGAAQVQGEIDISANTNAPIYNDDPSDRGYEIDSYLTGNGGTSIEYHGYNQTAFQSNYTNDLDIACATNAYSGKWNIVIGMLLGSGTNSLGTNDINISTNGAFETLYDVSNSTGNLFLSGQMYLHQNDTFKSLFINGAPLAVGTYSFAQLNTTYPTNFPATWIGHYGATTITNGSGSITVLVQPAPQISQQPTPASIQVYPGQPFQISAAAQGNLPLGYRWRQNGNFLADNSNISGSQTPGLNVAATVATNGGNYDVVVTNSVGSVTSSIVVVTVLPTGPATNLTLDFGGTPVQQPQGSDWNTPTNWSDGNPASVSAFSNPGSTYEVVPGARLRNPATNLVSTFPGGLLTIDGDGVFVNGPGVGATTAELRFKHPAVANINFPKLVMNGGQIDNGDNGTAIVGGEMDILASTAIYTDSTAGVDRPIQIDSFLTGTGTITYQAFDATFQGNLNVTCSSNTYSGQWNVLQGVLLGSGANSLGTNSITLANTAALETTYDIHSPSADLVVNGQVFLHQNDTFNTLTVNGVSVASGTYTFAQLNTAYPTNFPAAWPLQLGSAVNAGSGSITVVGSQGGSGGTPMPIGFTTSAGSLTLNWSQGTLQETTNFIGSGTVWTDVPGAMSPLMVVPNDPQHYYRVRP
ncbi:MAG TPA: immunoglobulin domain-containing protein [Verrucomicrobiae bacterium]|nr:immunoglobulin domain-containing protein [Verrucomicrobiae bacterium]